MPFSKRSTTPKRKRRQVCVCCRKRRLESKMIQRHHTKGGNFREHLPGLSHVKGQEIVTEMIDVTAMPRTIFHGWFCNAECQTAFVERLKDMISHYEEIISVLKVPKEPPKGRFDFPRY